MKMSDIFTNIKCPVCDGSNFDCFSKISFSDVKKKISIDYSIIGINDDTEFKYDKCKTCGFIFVNPRVDLSLMSKLYNDCKNIQNSDDYNQKSARKFRKHLKALKVLNPLLDIIARNKNFPVNLIDYGCGYGELLSLANNFGINTAGVEIDNNRIAACNKKNLNVFSFDEFIPANPGYKADIIVCMNAIEHLYDLNNFISFVSEISKKDTVIFINAVFPDVIKKEQKKKSIIDSHPVEHINYFNAKTLDFFMDKVNYRPIGNSYEKLISNLKVKVAAAISSTFKRIYICKKESSV